jgi:RNA polymerase sigma-70 factor (ECF subfamily)
MKYTPLFIDKLRKGDQKTFEMLYHDMFPSLVVFAKKYVDDDSLSEDIVQEVFVKFWNRMSSISIRISLKSYLYMAVRNHALDLLDKKANRGDNLNEHAFDEITSCDEFNMLSQDVYYQLNKAIGTLPKRSREVIKLSMNELSLAEIQDELDISRNTVKTLKRIGYSKLRNSMRSFMEYNKGD